MPKKYLSNPGRPEKAARRLSRSLIEPVDHRPFEEEITDCKEAIVAFLKRRNVREVNRYGWVLLRAIFGSKWKPGREKTRSKRLERSHPFAGKIKTRKDAQIAMERAKLGWFGMLEKPEEMMPRSHGPHAEKMLVRDGRSR